VAVWTKQMQLKCVLVVKKKLKTMFLFVLLFSIYVYLCSNPES